MGARARPVRPVAPPPRVDRRDPRRRVRRAGIDAHHVRVHGDAARLRVPRRLRVCRDDQVDRTVTRVRHRAAHLHRGIRTARRRRTPGPVRRGLVTGLLRELDWWAVAIAGWCVFVARPVSCRIALWRTPTRRIERRAIEFFGIRGIGSLCYVAYAVSVTDFVDRGRVWAVTSTTVLLSIVVHGVVAGPAMQRLDRYRPRRALRQRPAGAATGPA